MSLRMVLLSAVKGLNCCFHIHKHNTHSFSSNTGLFKGICLWKQYLFTNFGLQSSNKPVQHFIISDTHYTKMQHDGMQLYSHYIMHIVLCAFVQVIPSPLVPIFRPKIILYQLFQVFPDYKVPIQVLTLQPNSCIVSQQHWCKPSILVCIYSY